MPKPRKGENQNDFMNRCMGDDMMGQDFPDNKQRVAVCMRQWKTKGKREVTHITERRSLMSTLSSLEIEEKSSGLSGIRGYAAVYYNGHPDTQFATGKVVERIMPGTFSRALKDGADVICLFNHDDAMLLGRRSAKTLRLYDDEKGLRYSVDTPNTSYGRDLVEMIARGDIWGSSFSFGVNGIDGENWRYEGDTMIRELRDVNLFDVSPVVNPAYQATSLSLRSLQEWAEARQMSGADMQNLMDKATLCGFTIEMEYECDMMDGTTMPMDQGQMDMQRQKIRLTEMEAGLIASGENRFQHNSKTADSEPNWGNVDKTKLPRNAFADMGDATAVSTWGYPHHWVQNGGNPDDNGRYTTGTMLLHAVGLNAAWAAANGAHTGNKASQSILNHLQAHRRALGLDNA